MIKTILKVSILIYLSICSALCYAQSKAPSDYDVAKKQFEQGFYESAMDFFRMHIRRVREQGLEDSLADAYLQKAMECHRYCALAKEAGLKERYQVEEEYLRTVSLLNPYDKQTLSRLKELEGINKTNRDFVEMKLGLCMEMIYIDGGLFSMGASYEQTDVESDETPVRDVNISSFYMSEFEITQSQWEKVMGTTIIDQRNSIDPQKGLSGIGDNYPMYYVSWTEATEFCKRLSQLTGRTYVLPTEAQWEYAARGGRKRNYKKYSGSDDQTLKDAAWYRNNSSFKSHPVGQKKANELGLYDMSGNVWEWCSDWYGYYPDYEQTDPVGEVDGRSKITRGGSWATGAADCRVSKRGGAAPYTKINHIGFRVVCIE